MYDSKIETLEKQMVGMQQQHFSQIVGQFSQKIDALIAENAKIRLEAAARHPPHLSLSQRQVWFSQFRRLSHTCSLHLSH